MNEAVCAGGGGGWGELRGLRKAGHTLQRTQGGRLGALQTLFTIAAMAVLGCTTLAQSSL